MVHDFFGFNLISSLFLLSFSVALCFKRFFQNFIYGRVGRSKPAIC